MDLTAIVAITTVAVSFFYFSRRGDRSGKRTDLFVPLLEGTLEATSEVDVERELDRTSLIQSTHETQDFVGRFRNRSFVARTEYLLSGDFEQGALVDDQRGFWLQTDIALPRSTRASLIWDRPFATSGDKDLLVAITTDAVRKFGATGDSLTIHEGAVGFHGPTAWPGGRIQKSLILLDEIAKRVETVDGDIDSLLKETFRNDSNPVVRLESFNCLNRRWKGQGDRQSELRKEAARDGDFSIRVAAATSAGDIQKLRTMVLESDEPVPHRQSALRSLLGILPKGSRETLLQQLLDSAEPPLCLIAIEEFGERGPPSLVKALDPIRPIFEKSLAAPTAEALRRQPSLAAIPHLIALAEQTSDWHTRKKAVEVIGEVGDVSHVSWLRGLGFHEGTIETAVAKIQSRAPGAGGALSVVVPKREDEGALSPVSGPEGALSEPPTDL